MHSCFRGGLEWWDRAFTVMLVICLGTLPWYKVSAQETMTGNLRNYVEDIIDAMPGSGGNDYFDPNPFEAQDWTDLIDMLISQDYQGAADAAPTLSYQVIRFIDNTGDVDETYYILQKTDAGVRFWGTYIFNPMSCRPVVIQCPHPRVDSNTGFQGIFVFRETQAYAYMLTGTHRCNAAGASSCSGTTGVCGSTAPYRLSDVAHNTESAFQLTSNQLFDTRADLYFIQLHGFGMQSGDPFLIMSNGSRTTPDPDKLVELSNALDEIDPSLTFRIGHIDLSWNRLLGFTNTQGRYINGSPNPCTTNASTGNGHFMHIEQEFNKMRAGQSQWSKMSDALIDIYACVPSSTAGQEVVSFDFWSLRPDGTLVLDLDEGPVYYLEVYNLLGQVMYSAAIPPRIEVPLDSGALFFVVRSNHGYVGSGKVIGGILR